MAIEESRIAEQNKVGFVVAEVYEGSFELSDADRDRWKSDPEAVIADLLRHKGFDVNGIIASHADVIGSDGGCNCQWFHVVYPPAEESRWIWECV